VQNNTPKIVFLLCIGLPRGGDTERKKKWAGYAMFLHSTVKRPGKCQVVSLNAFFLIKEWIQGWGHGSCGRVLSSVHKALSLDPSNPSTTKKKKKSEEMEFLSFFHWTSQSFNKSFFSYLLFLSAWGHHNKISSS
jgi:hypothetical protein